MRKILIIEDDLWILNPLNLYLSKSEFEVVTCENWLDAMRIFLESKPELIILDINLPWKNGIEICREIREVDNTPVIILSARLDEEDKIMTLDLGADDYVSKPFSPRELLARINSVLKRVWQLSAISDSNPKNVSFKTINLDLNNYELLVNWKNIKVTKTEFLLLKYMIDNKDEVILREKVMKEIMWYDNYLYDRTIDTHVKNLRKKLDGAMNIETIRWIWYKIS